MIRCDFLLRGGRGFDDKSHLAGGTGTELRCWIRSGRDALSVGQGVIAAVDGLPAGIRRSLICRALGLRCGDGPARHDHRDRVAGALRSSALAVERGSNENLNRIERELFPQGVTITSNPDQLAMVASEINDRPREIHNWKKPSELFTELVETHASTA